MWNVHKAFVLCSGWVFRQWRQSWGCAVKNGKMWPAENWTSETSRGNSASNKDH